MQRPASLRDTPLALFLAGDLISAIGNRVQMFMLAMFGVSVMPTLQDQVDALALIMISGYVGFVSTSGIGGKLADQGNRWSIAILGWLTLGALALGSGFLVTMGVFSMLDASKRTLAIIGISFVYNAVSALTMPSSQSYFVDLARERVASNPLLFEFAKNRSAIAQETDAGQSQQAISERGYEVASYWLSSYNLVGQLVGSLVGTLFLKWEAYELAFFANALSFFFPMAVVIDLQRKGLGPKVPKTPEGQENTSEQAHSWLEEWRFGVLRQRLRENPLVMTTFLITLVLWGLMTNGDLTGPLIAMRVFGDLKVSSFFQGAAIVGWLIGSVLLILTGKPRQGTSRVRRWVQARAYPLALIVFSSCLALYSLGITLWLSVVMMVIPGVIGRIIYAHARVVMVKSVRTEILGRLNGQYNRAEFITKLLGMVSSWVLVRVNLRVVTPTFEMIGLALGVLFLVVRPPHYKEAQGD